MVHLSYDFISKLPDNIVALVRFSSHKRRTLFVFLEIDKSDDMKSPIGVDKMFHFSSWNTRNSPTFTESLECCVKSTFYTTNILPDKIKIGKHLYNIVLSKTI